MNLAAHAIRGFPDFGHHSLAIIAKPQKQANRLYQSLADTGGEVRLFATHTLGFSGGVIVSSAHLVKGLEFDHVIVVDVSKKNYHTETDRYLL